MSLQAVILAGGLGTRLRPLTNTIPKPLVPVGGRPFIFHLLALLSRQGITDVILCSGYLGEQLREACGDGTQWGVTLRDHPDGNRLMGTGGALKQAEHLLRPTFFLLFGDTFLPIDYPRLMESFQSKRSDAAALALLTAYNNREETGATPNLTLRDGWVTRYWKGGCEVCTHVDAGVAVVDRKLLEWIPSGRPVSLEEGVYPLLAGRGRLAAEVVTQRFYDIGTPDGLARFAEYLERSDRPWGHRNG